jgi:hypothetical protein
MYSSGMEKYRVFCEKVHKKHEETLQAQQKKWTAKMAFLWDRTREAEEDRMRRSSLPTVAEMGEVEIVKVEEGGEGEEGEGGEGGGEEGEEKEGEAKGHEVQAKVASPVDFRKELPTPDLALQAEYLVELEKLEKLKSEAMEEEDAKIKAEKKK